MRIMEASHWLLSKKQFKPLQLKNNQPKKLFQHIPTKQIVAEQFIRISYCDYMKEYAHYQWRYFSSNTIFKVYSGTLIKKMRQGVIVSILISSPHYLLTAVKQLSFLNTLKLLKIVLQTLPELIKKFGIFQLTESMIGLMNNKVKFWINQDFTVNHPQYYAQSEEKMIKELFSLVKNKTQQTQESINFFQLLQKEDFTIKSILSFLKKLLIQKIARKNSLRLNDRCQSLSLSSWKRYSQIDSLQGKRAQSKLKLDKFENDSQISRNLLFKTEDQEQIPAPKSYFVPKLINRNSSFTMKNSEQTFRSTQMTSMIKSNFLKSQIVDPKYSKGNRIKMTRVLQLDLSPSCIKQGKKSLAVQSKKSLGLDSIKKQTKTSNCWSDTLNGIGSPKCSLMTKNNWTNHFQMLLHSRKNLGASIHFQDSAEQEKKKIEELRKLRLEKFGGSQQVFRSIIQDDFNDRQFEQQ